MVGSEWLSAAQAASVLGVKPATVYAYVSRGVLTRRVKVIDGRRVSRFNRRDVATLAAERDRPRAGVLTALVESQVTQLEANGRLRFREVDVAECVAWGFERTAKHVVGDTGLAWPTCEAPRVNDSGTLADLVRSVVLALAGKDKHRSSTNTTHCRHVALRSIEAAVALLAGPTPETVATRLARAWATADGGQPNRAVVTALDCALTVLVDHELTSSTLATRAAAGTGADPWLVLLTGLSAMGGPAQAGASQAARTVLQAWLDGRAPSGARVPGFGHKVYVGPDPRAELLLGAVAGAAPDVVEQVESLAVHVAREHGAYPNIDVALAALMIAAGLPAGAGEVIFMLARISGLMAHALEEYPQGLRLRPRAMP